MTFVAPMLAELEADGRDLCIKHGLRRVVLVSDTHVVTVDEPGWWDHTTDLITTTKEINL